MRKFTYFLFENFDAELERGNPLNPRNFTGAATDEILSFVAQYPAGHCPQRACVGRFDARLLQQLLRGGILRVQDGALMFDCPIFLSEDAEALQQQVQKQADYLAAILLEHAAPLRICCEKIKNGACIEENLYHIVCGNLLDGLFLDRLQIAHVLSGGRQHSSGLEYLSIIYEQCAPLKLLSDELLCSYNRLSNAHCALQSFGDAQGARFDCYRVFRQLEHGVSSARLHRAALLLEAAFGSTDQNALLTETALLVKTGRCKPAAMAILELFGYVKDGRLCVPVYTPEHEAVILEMEQIVADCLYMPISQALTELARTMNITAVRHGIRAPELANELYHILFGTINETLIRTGFVAHPLCRPGEGRYLQSIALYD